MCPDPLKIDNCLSDGKYCAFFPKVEDEYLYQSDPEDYGAYNNIDGNISGDFSGRQLLMSSIAEKCYHEQVKKLISQDSEDLE